MVKKELKKKKRFRVLMSTKKFIGITYRKEVRLIIYNMNYLNKLYNKKMS